MGTVHSISAHAHDLAYRCRAAVDAAERAQGKALELARSAGELLLEAKRQAGHGNWLVWLRVTGIAERTAQHYMQITTDPEAIDRKRERDRQGKHARRDKSARRRADLPTGKTEQLTPRMRELGWKRKSKKRDHRLAIGLIGDCQGICKYHELLNLTVLKPLLKDDKGLLRRTVKTLLKIARLIEPKRTTLEDDGAMASELLREAERLCKKHSELLVRCRSIREERAEIGLALHRTRHDD